MDLFDDVAEGFTKATDRALEQNSYLRGQLVLEMAERMCSAGSVVLDYGCGPGRVSLMLARAGFRVHGVDISEGMLAQARKLDCRGLDLTFASLKSQPDALLPETCDAIVCSSVIEYVRDPEALLTAFHGALRKPGVLLISYANKSSLWRRYTDRKAQRNPMYDPDNKTWRWRDFRALLDRSGFRTVCGPRFYESPLDQYRTGRWFRRLALGGSLGLLAAQPVTHPNPR